MNDDSRICITCGATSLHPTLLACIEFLRARLDATTIELSDAQQAKIGAEEKYEQVLLNWDYLRAKVDRAHSMLCPELCGTWQQKATQLVDAVRRITSTSTKSEPR